MVAVSRILIVLALVEALLLSPGCNYDVADIQCADSKEEPVVTRNADGELAYLGCVAPDLDPALVATWMEFDAPVWVKFEAVEASAGTTGYYTRTTAVDESAIELVSGTWHGGNGKMLTSIADALTIHTYELQGDQLVLDGVAFDRVVGGAQ